jgi:glycerophosphoryl diester phosphodiesterase
MQGVDGRVVLILAHRGLPGTHRPENSLAAVAAAFDSGADGVEVDLRLTADGVLALSHDAGLDRIAGLPATIADSRWPALIAAAGHHGVRLARAEEVLVQAAGRHVVLEVKAPPPGRGLEARTASAVADLVHASGAAGLALDVTVSSFSPQLVARIGRLLPRSSGVRTALLGCPRDRAASVLRQALDGGQDEVHPHVSSLQADPRVVAAARACGVAVVPWTVNAPGDVRRMEALGVHGLISDVPSTARAAVSRAAISRAAVGRATV